jgi:hypothetical protein
LICATHNGQRAPRCRRAAGVLSDTRKEAHCRRARGRRTAPQKKPNLAAMMVSVCGFIAGEIGLAL